MSTRTSACGRDPATDASRADIGRWDGLTRPALELRPEIVDAITDRRRRISMKAYVSCLFLAGSLVGEPFTLSAGWTDPLRKARRVRPPDLPPGLNRVEPTPRAAADLLRRSSEGQMWPSPGQVHLDRVECSVLGQERRVPDQRRVSARDAATRSAVARTRDRCGLPLSDPVGVSSDIGPGCRKDDSDQVLSEIRRGGRSGPCPVEGRAVPRWVADVRLQRAMV